MKQIKGGVTAAKGFKAASTAAGIKYQNRQDMAMIYSEVPCDVAGTFTKNIVKAAPVKWDQHVVYESKKAQAVVVNAGIANACTGEEGMGYCKQTAEKVSALLGVPEDQVLVRCSWRRQGSSASSFRSTASVRESRQWCLHFLTATRAAMRRLRQS